MNSLGRIKETVNFGIPDRSPVIAQVFGHAAILSNVTLEEYVKSGEVLAQCQINALKRYNHDAVFALADVNVETEAVGSKLIYSNNKYPHVARYALTNQINLDTMPIPNPRKAGRMPELLKAAKILRHEVGDEVPVVGCVLGPMTLATQLIGIESALYLAIDEPELFARLLDFSKDVIVNFGLAQIEAGAHLPIVFEPSASPAVIPYQFFREFVLPRLKEIFATFKQGGSQANWLHIAGPTGSVLPFYTQIGVDIANFDYCVPLSEARQALPQTCLDGNIKSWLFVEGTPEAMTIESAKLLEGIADRGGFILSSGCEIPPESKPENITAMVKSVLQDK